MTLDTHEVLRASERSERTPPADPWTELERAARRQIEETETPPLTFGEKVAWTGCHYGKTDELSKIHRVANPDGEEPQTFCGEAIPDGVRRFPPLRSLDICRTCELAWGQSLTGLTVSA